MFTYLPGHLAQAYQCTLPLSLKTVISFYRPAKGLRDALNTMQHHSYALVCNLLRSSSQHSHSRKTPSSPNWPITKPGAIISQKQQVKVARSERIREMARWLLYPNRSLCASIRLPVPQKPGSLGCWQPKERSEGSTAPSFAAVEDLTNLVFWADMCSSNLWPGRFPLSSSI